MKRKCVLRALSENYLYSSYHELDVLFLVAFDEKDIDEKNGDVMEQDSKFMEEESTSEEEFEDEDKRVAKRGPQEEKPKKGNGCIC